MRKGTDALMLRLAKYLKPFIPLLVVAIVLLFVQAVSDLSLPNYLSKIVNIGIQQGGVENAVAKAIRQSEMSRLTLFMSDNDKAEVLKQYTLVDKNSPNYSQDVKDYPALANAPIYFLNNIDQTEVDKLNPILGKTWLAVSTIEQIMADPSKAANMGQGVGGFDLSKLPKGTDPFFVLSFVPAQTRPSFLAVMKAEFR